MPKAGNIALAVAVVVIVVFCAGSYAVDRQLLGRTYARYVPDGPSLMLTDDDVAADYPSGAVEFHMNGAVLRGRVYEAWGAAGAGRSQEPDGATMAATRSPRGLVVFRHGIFSQHQDYLALITALVDKGWKVFAYDAVGCGDSDGDSVIGFAQAPLDVHAAVRFALESGMADGLPLALVGHSWGGYGVAGALDFADVRDNVFACVTMSGFDTPDAIIMESAANNMGPLAATQRPFIDLIGLMDFGVDAGRSAVAAVNESGVPTLVIHGVGDAVVSFGGASIIAACDSISNPEAVYIVKDEPGRDGHNTYFYSPESQAYLAECADAVNELQQRYAGDDIPDDVLAQAMDDVDKRRANTADPVLIDEIDAFLTDHAD